MRLSPKSRIFIVIFSGVLIAILLLFVSVSSILKKSNKEQAPAVHYLQEEEAVVIKSEEKIEVLPVKPVLFEYVEAIDGCGPYFEGPCLNARSGPGQDYDVILRLRNGMVLKVGGMVERDGKNWYKIKFDEHIRYPERVRGDFYVAAEYVRALLDEGDRDITDVGDIASSTKRIIIDRSEQALYAYDGDELFMQTKISTGLELTPTPRGAFTIFKKTPSRYMQGPLPGISDQYYDLPGVPWNLYFTEQGGAIHGAYWHNKFGQPWSHGCVNLPLPEAKKLYIWADIGTSVLVRD
ncbi:MAG: L,D-transpeptidase family protein, partial [bacterium]|nr:L,D-transpeptidase family protein [bacterium]